MELDGVWILLWIWVDPCMLLVELMVYFGSSQYNIQGVQEFFFFSICGGREVNHTHMASGPQFPLNTVFAALHFTRLSSVPHLSALPPNLFNFKCLLSANRELVCVQYN